MEPSVLGARSLVMKVYITLSDAPVERFTGGCMCLVGVAEEPATREMLQMVADRLIAAWTAYPIPYRELHE